MKLAVVAANGKVGSAIVMEAVARGWEVTAIVRGGGSTGGVEGPGARAASSILVKDIMALEAADLAGFDVVVDAFGVFDPDRQGEHTETLMHLADLLAGTDTRLLVVGGAGSLYVDPDRQTQLVDTPDFPPAHLPVARGMRAAWERLAKRTDVHWTYVSPAAFLNPDGERTGQYRLGDDQVPVNSAGQSVISYPDFALALTDLVAQGLPDRTHLSAVSK